MQSKFTRYLAAGFLAITFAGAGLMSTATAQWMVVGSPYRATVYPSAHVYPSYVAWRPFGGLFAGLHGLLCPHCWHSPCSCFRPAVVCDPCWTPCIDPCCDPCYVSSCCTVCGISDGCNCVSGYVNYDQPVSKTLGDPSPTGFGSVSPSVGIQGERPVGTQGITSTPRQPLTTSRPANEPTVAPPQNQVTNPPADDFSSRIIPRNNSGSTGIGSYGAGAADVPPTTDSTGATFSNPASTTEHNWMNVPGPETTQPGGIHTTPDGSLPHPVGAPGTGMQPENQPGTGNSTQNRMIDLGTGLISVTVPEHSKVYINGYETKMTGVNRKFVVNDLTPGMQYDYDVKIVANVNGQAVAETHRVTLSSGQQDALVFGQPRPQLDNGNSRSYIAARPVQ